MEDMGPPEMSMTDLERKHDSELEEYKLTCKLNLKNAKKSEKAVVESKNIQGEFDLRARHREEMELLELQIGIGNLCLICLKF